MRFVQHPTNDLVLSAPKGWDQSKVECGALPVTRTKVDGEHAMLSFWQPSDEERAAIAAGANVTLLVFGMFHPPVALQVEAKK